MLERKWPGACLLQGQAATHADRSTQTPRGDGVTIVPDAPEISCNTNLSATRGLHDVLQRVEAEYREMPGLSLTVPQAARLWGLDSRTCDIVLTTLLDRQVLRRTAIGTYLR